MFYPIQIKSISSLICTIADILVLPDGKNSPGEEKEHLIQAVRPVGDAPLAVQYCALTVPLAVRLRLANLNRLYIPWHRLSLLLALLDRSDPGKSAAPAVHMRGEIPDCISSGTLTLRTADDQKPGALDPWRPWPAHEPFADEIKRWWPSDEPPPIQATGAMDTGPADLRPRFVLWPAYGGLLDTWV